MRPPSAPPSGFDGTLLTDGHGTYRRYAEQGGGLVHV